VADAPFVLNGEATQLPVTISIGVAASQAGDTPEVLLKRADQALYRAKRDGRNRVAADAA
jgi:two-component system cell cycle response regulator